MSYYYRYRYRNIDDNNRPIDRHTVKRTAACQHIVGTWDRIVFQEKLFLGYEGSENH